MAQLASLTINAELRNLGTIRAFVQEQMMALRIDAQQIDHLVLAADEIATNIIMHGYKMGPGSIEVEVGWDGQTLTITLQDRAPVFNPNTVPEPDITLPLDQRALGGMGVFLARRASDEIRHTPRPDGGNSVTLVKHNLIK